MSQQQLESIVSIVRAHEQESKHSNSEEVDIDLNDLKPKTLREMERYVRTTMEGKVSALTIVIPHLTSD